MPEIKDLNSSERVLLAGCLKGIILADGQIEERELDVLERITNLLNFPDFDQALAEFERSVKSEEDFRELAKNIYHKEAQSLTTQILWEMVLQGGFPQPQAQAVIQKLRDWWKE